MEGPGQGGSLERAGPGKWMVVGDGSWHGRRREEIEQGVGVGGGWMD